MIPENKLLDDLKNQPLDYVLEKYDLSLHELFQLQLNRNYRIRQTSYIHKTKSKKYSINKTIEGKSYYYGSYADKKEAELIVEALIECGWDSNMLPEILERLDIKSKSEND